MREVERERERETQTQRHRETDRQTDRHIGRQTDIQSERGRGRKREGGGRVLAFTPSQPQRTIRAKQVTMHDTFHC